MAMLVTQPYPLSRIPSTGGGSLSPFPFPPPASTSLHHSPISLLPLYILSFHVHAMLLLEDLLWAFLH